MNINDCFGQMNGWFGTDLVDQDSVHNQTSSYILSGVVIGIMTIVLGIFIIRYSNAPVHHSPPSTDSLRHDSDTSLGSQLFTEQLLAGPSFQSTFQSPSGSQFQVTIQSKETWGEVIDIAMAWQSRAMEIESRACDEKFQELLPLGRVRPIEGQSEMARIARYNWVTSLKEHPALSIADCRAMTMYINDALTGGQGGEFDTVLVSRSVDAKIQAMALYDQKHNKLVCMVTDPDNINHQVNQENPNQVRGAGTSIMFHLFRHTVISGLPLKVDSLLRAEGFYRKLQFERTGERSLRDVSMELTPATIRRLAGEKVSPFDQI